jgi:hypothetical protein
MAEEFLEQCFQVLDNPGAYEPKIKFLKRERKLRFVLLSFIISLNSSCAVSGTPTSNVKGDSTKGKRLLGISGKYLENCPFKLSKCTSVSEYACVHVCITVAFFKVSSKHVCLPSFSFF